MRKTNSLLNHMNQKEIWLAVREAIATAGTDVPSSTAVEYEKAGLNELRSVLEKAGADKVIASIKKYTPDDPSYEFYWLARSGCMEVVPELLALVTLNDEDQVVNAAIGLAHLGHQKGFDVIEKMCLGEFQIKLSMSPTWTFSEFLKDMDDPRADRLAKNITQGVYGNWNGKLK